MMPGEGRGMKLAPLTTWKINFYPKHQASVKQIYSKTLTLLGYSSVSYRLICKAKFSLTLIPTHRCSFKGPSHCWCQESKLSLSYNNKLN